MRYAGITENDIVNCDDGVCVSFWTQGCHFRCEGCHNPETWNPSGGKELPENYIEIVLELLTKNSIQRHLSILGGEPLMDRNRDIVCKLLQAVKTAHPQTKVYLWTGNTLNDILPFEVLAYVDVLITEPFVLSLRDITLKLRGSSNQKIYRRNGKEFILSDE
ncbi:MAG: anaerobic ribonucleoside-triphosphate reductase activating protein [Brevinema sp.]